MSLQSRLFAGCLALSACASPTSTAPHASKPWVRAETQGVWYAREYGWLLEASPRRLRLHHTSSAGCYADPMNRRTLRELFAYARSDAGELRVQTLPGDTVYRFTPLDALPAACESRRWDAPAVFEVFAATFGELYPFFDARGVDWPARVSAGRARVAADSGDAALFEAMTTALAGLGDAHVKLTAEVDGAPREFEEPASRTLARISSRGRAEGVAEAEAQRTWRRQYREGVLQTVLRGEGRSTANGRIFWGFAAPGIGYLNVVTMGGFLEDGSFADELAALEPVLDEAMSAFQGARAVIVDVSCNHGGYDFIGRAIASRFADQRRLAYRKRAGMDDDAPAQAFAVEPSGRPSFRKKVVLLTSDITVSAGETFSTAMRALPHVIHVGTTTRGAFSDVLEKPLPNGWKVELSNEIYLDPAGEVLEVRGVRPQETLELFPEDDLEHGHAKAVRRLADRLAEAPD